LRKSSLDELPQLFNVLIGRMSLVGPRMITAPELEKYGEQQQLLLTVKPGITGYWQVHGRQEVSYTERVRMDMEYIRNWSLRLDFELLMRTPGRVIRGRGAY
jgi:lipopolysaccharide/colanic/teichoic acid biosynthesis glycosyltransferase